MQTKAISALFALAAAMTGCDSDNQGGAGSEDSGSSADAKEVGEGPCESTDECAGDVCVGLIDGDNPAVYCSETCESGSCPDGFVCDTETFALAGISFCRFGEESEALEAPEEPPALPCVEDADCDDGLICATLGDESGCAKPCNQESDCDLPSLGGVVIDAATCGEDDNGRSVCVGDPACYPAFDGCIGTGV